MTGAPLYFDAIKTIIGGICFWGGIIGLILTFLHMFFTDFFNRKISFPLVGKVGLENALKAIYGAKKFSDDKLVIETLHDPIMNFDSKNYLLSILNKNIPIYGEVHEGFKPSKINETELYMANKANAVKFKRYDDTPAYYNCYVLKKDIYAYFK